LVKDIETTNRVMTGLRKNWRAMTTPKNEADRDRALPAGDALFCEFSATGT
jgi:hypothetical protein